MIKLIVDINQLGLLSMLKGYPERVATSLVSAMNRLTIAIQARVKEKLSGEVLHVRTGTLRRSINREVRYAGHGLIEGIVGTNVEYAAIHEYGFHGTETVRAHVRKIREHSKMYLFGTASGMARTEMRWKRGKLTGGIANVKEHSRTVNMPERSFLRSTLKDFEQRIKDELQAAAAKALKP